jgi:glucose-6-phosphate dehydrogenase assembly protein OpcA
MELADALSKLTSVFGSTGALAVCAWWYERRANRELQRQLMKLAAAQIQAASEIRAALESIRDHL